MGMGWGDDPGEFVSEVVDKIGRFSGPSHIRLKADHLYVSDTSAGVVAVYDTAGRLIRTVTDCGSPLGLDVEHVEVTTCNDPRPITHTPKGELLPGCTTETVERLYVGDKKTGAVRIFSNGEQTGHLGSGTGEFLVPNGIALTAGTVYVVDSKRHEVRTYDKSGTFTGSFGGHGTGNGQLDFPIDIVIDESVNEIYISDWRNRRIVVFDLAGTWLRNLQTPLNDSGDDVFFRPSGLGIDPGGNLYVVDNALSAVAVMNRFSVLIDVFGYQNGTYWTRELDVPIDAASDGNRVFVTSSEDGRVHVFEVAP
jgi:DNA-binding beta-propeller fold protein YncE